MFEITQWIRCSTYGEIWWMICTHRNWNTSQSEIFSFNSYVYYITQGLIALTHAFNLPTRVFNFATRALSLLTRGFELVTRYIEYIEDGNDEDGHHGIFRIIWRRVKILTRMLSWEIRVCSNLVSYREMEASQIPGNGHFLLNPSRKL